MPEPARIVVVGSTNTDMVVKTRTIPKPGETVLGGDFLMAAGGKGANQAVAAARLGARVSFVARVGTDLFGDRSLANIGVAGVDTTYVARSDASPSGVALICVDESGQNSIVVAPGANAELSPADVDAALPAIEACTIVVMQLEIPLATVRHAIDVAHRHGKTVILNPAPAPVETLVVSGVDVLTPNEVEACMLLGRPCDDSFDPQQAARDLLRATGVGAVVVTLGAHGAVVATAGRVSEIPARRVKAVDATAAGDCFAGALACALGEGVDLGPAVHFANAAAALSVTRMGAQPSMPSRDDVEEFIKRR